MRRFPDRPVVGVGAVVLDRDQVVLVRRGHEPMKGEWSLPGGAVELGETLVAALERELLEETGLTVHAGPVVEVVDRVHRGADGRIEYHFVVVDYLCRVAGGELLSGSDAAEICWAPVHDLGPFRLTAQARAVIQKAVTLSAAAPIGSLG